MRCCFQLLDIENIEYVCVWVLTSSHLFIKWQSLLYINMDFYSPHQIQLNEWLRLYATLKCISKPGVQGFPSAVSLFFFFLIGQQVFSLMRADSKCSHSVSSLLECVFINWIDLSLPVNLRQAMVISQCLHLHCHLLTGMLHSVFAVNSLISLLLIRLVFDRVSQCVVHVDGDIFRNTLFYLTCFKFIFIDFCFWIASWEPDLSSSILSMCNRLQCYIVWVGVVSIFSDFP